MADKRLLASLDLMRRMPPSRMESSLEGTARLPTPAQRSRARRTPCHSTG